METALQLLMPDGALRVSFYPRLSVQQYAELLESANRATTRAEWRQEIENVAKRWGIAYEVDSGLSGNHFKQP